MKIIAQRESSPDRTEITGSEGDWCATLTDGAYTAALLGPTRTFRESTRTVTHAIWVRCLPAPFDGDVDKRWLRRALQANQKGVPDVLAIAMQYIEGAPPLSQYGLQIAGNAAYGPVKGGSREEGSDFNDYLGVVWNFPEKLEQPEPRQRRCLDCSGFVRMIWGFRHSGPGLGYADVVPLCLNPRKDRGAIPRRAYQICEAGPGVLIARSPDTQLSELSALRVGDLVFFDADKTDGARIDHVGMYLGRDDRQHHRFISSRKGANGPTFGDLNGKSILDGTGLYAKALRTVRRL